MTNVIPLFEPTQEMEPSTFAAAWSLLPPTMKTRSDSKSKCEVLWDKQAKAYGGQVTLLGKLRTYLRDDKDIVRSGGPGFQVLLRSGRLEHWVATTNDTRPVEPFANNVIRSQVLAIKGEAFCRSYLDRCSIEGNTLIVATDYSIGKLREVAGVFKLHGLTGMKKRGEDHPPRLP